MWKIAVIGAMFVIVAGLAGILLNKSSNKPINISVPGTTTSTVLLYSSPAIPSPKTTKAPLVPLPAGEDIIRTFFNLINEKKISEAISMLSSQSIPDESARQQWSVTFNAFDSANVKTIEEFDKQSWTDTSQTYKVTVNISLNKPPSDVLWENGNNTRWITLVKENQIWKISGFATGP